MRIDILTLFPEMFDALNHSIIKRALDKNLFEINVINIRDFSKDAHKKCDDYPYGGGAGMVMMPQPIVDAYNSIAQDNDVVIYTSPKGKTFNHQMAKSLAKKEHLVILCGHYEGVDERALEILNAKSVSIGDYVLTGGELPAMVMIDSIARQIEGVIAKDSLKEESFSNGLLEYPQYTRPEEFQGIKVPEVLQSGHHENINKWRRREAIKTTYIKRPELLEKVNLTDEEEKYLRELKNKED